MATATPKEDEQTEVKPAVKRATSAKKTEVVKTEAKPEDKVIQEAPVETTVNPLEITITNNGPRTFEVFTKTELPAGKTIVIQCRDLRQRKAVISKLKQLNALAKKPRYEFGEV